MAKMRDLMSCKMKPAMVKLAMLEVLSILGGLTKKIEISTVRSKLRRS